MDQYKTRWFHKTSELSQMKRTRNWWKGKFELTDHQVLKYYLHFIRWMSIHNRFTNFKNPWQRRLVRWRLNWSYMKFEALEASVHYFVYRGLMLLKPFVQYIVLLADVIKVTCMFLCCTVWVVLELVSVTVLWSIAPFCCCHTLIMNLTWVSLYAALEE